MDSRPRGRSYSRRPLDDKGQISCDGISSSPPASRTDLGRYGILAAHPRTQQHFPQDIQNNHPGSFDGRGRHQRLPPKNWLSRQRHKPCYFDPFTSRPHRGLRDFPAAKIHLHQSAIELLQRGAGLIRNIIFRELLPEDFWSRVTPMQRDVLGDESLTSILLPGHAIGQVGIEFHCAKAKVLLPADACWLSQSYRTNTMPHPVTRAIHSIPEYSKSLKTVHDLAIQNPGMVVLPSHCPETAKLICG